MATAALGNAKNAGLFAVQILVITAGSDDTLRKNLRAYRSAMAAELRRNSRSLRP